MFHSRLWWVLGGNWEEVALLAKKWVGYTRDDDFSPKDLNVRTHRTDHPGQGEVKALEECPSGDDLNSCVKCDDEIAQQLRGARSSALAVDANPPPIQHTGTDSTTMSRTSSHYSSYSVESVRRRDRSSSLSSSACLRPSSQSTSSSSIDNRYRSLVGRLFEKYTRLAITEYVSNRNIATAVEPSSVALLESDVILQMTADTQSRDLLPRQFYWRSEDIKLRTGDFVIIECKLSGARSGHAEEQLMSRKNGIKAPNHARIHPVLVISEGFQILAKSGIHVVCTEFDAELATEVDDALGGFTLPDQFASVDASSAGDVLDVLPSLSSLATQVPSFSANSGALLEPLYERSSTTSDRASVNDVLDDVAGSSLPAQRRGRSPSRSQSNSAAITLDVIVGDWSDGSPGQIKVDGSGEVRYYRWKYKGQLYRFTSCGHRGWIEDRVGRLMYKYKDSYGVLLLDYRRSTQQVLHWVRGNHSAPQETTWRRVDESQRW